MNLAKAQHYAEHLLMWLAPYCERIEVAGSIRRGLANCNDVDLVCIPKMDIERDMLQEVTGERNLLWEFLTAHVAAGKATIQSGGNQPGKYIILQLPKCQLDVFFATEETWGTRFLCRTGSKEHNIWLATHAREQGFEWKPYEGLLRDGAFKRCRTESELYAQLSLGFIEPKNREIDWLRKNCSGERV